MKLSLYERDIYLSMLPRRKVSQNHNTLAHFHYLTSAKQAAQLSENCDISNNFHAPGVG